MAAIDLGPSSEPRAAWGRAFLLVVRYSSHHQQPVEDFELASHSNETIAAVRRHILQRLKLSYQSRLELSVGNEVLRVTDDRRVVSAVPLRDRAVNTGWREFVAVLFCSLCRC